MRVKRDVFFLMLWALCAGILAGCAAPPALKFDESAAQLQIFALEFLDGEDGSLREIGTVDVENNLLLTDIRCLNGSSERVGTRYAYALPETFGVISAERKVVGVLAYYGAAYAVYEDNGPVLYALASEAMYRWDVFYASAQKWQRENSGASGGGGLLP